MSAQRVCKLRKRWCASGSFRKKVRAVSYKFVFFDFFESPCVKTVKTKA